VEFFQSIQPFLLTSYSNIWTKVFADPVRWDEIAEAAIWLGSYSLCFVVASWFIFVRKDILT
jgi:hypothetical protein